MQVSSGLCLYRWPVARNVDVFCSVSLCSFAFDSFIRFTSTELEHRSISVTCRVALLYYYVCLISAGGKHFFVFLSNWLQIFYYFVHNNSFKMCSVVLLFFFGITSGCCDWVLCRWLFFYTNSEKNSVILQAACFPDMPENFVRYTT